MSDHCQVRQSSGISDGEQGMNMPFKKKSCRVPIVMQMETTECGAACLNMILSYYGKWMPLEVVRRDCDINRDGSNANNMIRAARTYGLEAGGYSWPLEKLDSIPVPAILHWNFNHFVVFAGFEKKQAVIYDPAFGKQLVSMKQMDQSYTGVAITFKPGPGFQKAGREITVFRYMKERLKGAGVAVFAAILFSFLAAVTAIAGPMISRIYLDYILSGRNPEWLLPLMLGMLCLLIYEMVAVEMEAWYMMKINGRLASTAAAGFMWHVLHLPVDFFFQRYAGDIALRQESSQSIAKELVTGFAPMLIQFCMMVFYIVTIWNYSVVLTLISMVCMLTNVFLARKMMESITNRRRGQLQYEGKSASATLAGIEMIETIKGGGCEDGYFQKLAGLNANIYNYGQGGLNFKLQALSSFVENLVNGIVLLSGAMLIIRGRLSVGILIAVQGLVGQMSQPFGNMLKLSQSYQSIRNDIERVEDVMQYPVDIPETEMMSGTDTGEAVSVEKKLRGEVELRNLTFGYSSMNKPLIEDFSLHIRPGEVVALVGSSGCGKSTLARLISGLYKPWSGEILFDGRPASEIPRNVMTSSLAVVDQDIVLFEDTVGENICFWDHTIEDFEIILAARDAQIHDEIVAREGGYHAVIRENGKNYSGGQCQRFEIARVLAADPTILILDEATSALDAETEYRVTKAIRNRGISCIVVAHRLSTIRDADEIIVLDHGKVIERGTHEQLMAGNGKYTELITME